MAPLLTKAPATSMTMVPEVVAPTMAELLPPMVKASVVMDRLSVALTLAPSLSTRLCADTPSVSLIKRPAVPSVILAALLWFCP
jgi:hypothetical protein